MGCVECANACLKCIRCGQESWFHLLFAFTIAELLVMADTDAKTTISQEAHDCKLKTPCPNLGFANSESDSEVDSEEIYEKHKKRVLFRFNDNVKAQLLHDLESVGGF